MRFQTVLAAAMSLVLAGVAVASPAPVTRVEPDGSTTIIIINDSYVIFLVFLHFRKVLRFTHSVPTPIS
jgi:hypothetical protein